MMDTTGVHHATKNIWHMCLSETDGKTLNALIYHHVVHLDCHLGVTVYHFATCLGAPIKSPQKCGWGNAVYMTDVMSWCPWSPFFNMLRHHVPSAKLT